MHRVLRSLLAAAIAAALMLSALPALAAAPPTTTDVTAQAARVQAFKNLITLLDAYKSGQPVDWKAARELYVSALRSMVQARDTEFKEQLDVEITGALDAGEAGQLTPAVARQLVDKLMQKAFYLTVKHEFIEAVESLEQGDKAEATHEVDEAIAYFEALRGTVQKRDTAYKLNLEATIDGLLATALDEVAKGNGGALATVGAAVDYTLLRTFYLAALGYAGKIPAAAPDEARIQMAEGWAFFRSLQGVVPEPHFSAVMQMFNPVQGDPQQVSKQTYVNEAGLGLLAHARAELNGVFANWGKPEAVIEAFEVGLTLQMLEADTDVALPAVWGEQGKAQLNAAVQGLIDAVQQGDQARARTQRERVLDGIGTLAAHYAGAPDRVVLAVGSRTISLLGQLRQIEAAPFVAGERTMVPVRFVAEAMGARVTWNSGTRTVGIALGGKSIALPVGRAEATVDGRQVALDAPAQLVSDRVFVPVRFVSEVLGARVQWQAAHQTVTVQPAK